MANTRLLLMSNSKNAGQDYLSHALVPIRVALGFAAGEVLFIPYAAVTRSYDQYESVVSAAFAKIGYEIISIHRSDDPQQAVANAKAIVVGGGNTFHLLRQLQDHDLIAPIHERVKNGVPYIGWSAGSNVACPTIRTTNDMPIVEPKTLNALGLVPFQINPHYLDTHPEGHQGETREERLLEFVQVNEGVRVVGLREGSMLWIHGDVIQLIGGKSARVFVKGAEPKEYEPDFLQF
jgi:dipeptidase E